MALSVDFKYCPTPITAGCKVKFTPILDPEDPEDGSYTYSWNFDDCTDISTESNPCHIFKHPGTYNVKLVVNDGVEDVPITKCIVVVASFWSSFLCIFIFIIIVSLIVVGVWYLFFKKKNNSSPSTSSSSKKSKRSRRR